MLVEKISWPISDGKKVRFNCLQHFFSDYKTNLVCMYFVQNKFLGPNNVCQKKKKKYSGPENPPPM